MNNWMRRVLIGAAVAIGGSAYSLVFGGGTFPHCLGPLGVTLVRCVAHGGRPPTDPLWPPMVIASCALGAIIALPARRSWIDGVAFVVGLIAGPLAFALTRTATLGGTDYDGTWLVVPVAVDPWAVAWWAAAGCLVALLVTGLGQFGAEAFGRRGRRARGS